MKPLYKYSAETAKHDGEIDAWRESRDVLTESAVALSLKNCIGNYPHRSVVAEFFDCIFGALIGHSICFRESIS